MMVNVLASCGVCGTTFNWEVVRICPNCKKETTLLLTGVHDEQEVLELQDRIETIETLLKKKEVGKQ